MIVVSLKEAPRNLSPGIGIKEIKSWLSGKIISRPYDHYKR